MDLSSIVRAAIESRLVAAPPTDNLPHDDPGPQLNFTIWLLTGLAFGFLALRVYCKFLRGRGLWWDDYVLIGSWVCLAVASTMTSVSVKYGFGKHPWDQTLPQLVRLPLVSNIAGTFSILAAMWSKTSFAMTVLRISSGWMRWSIWFIIMSLNVIMGASALFEWITCAPLEKSWHPWIEGKCWSPYFVVSYFMFSTALMAVSLAAYSGVMDIILAIFPWKIIWGMMMNKKEKIGVLFAMSMGVFAGAASFIKVTQLASLHKSDSSATVQLVIWGVGESAITIIAASIPILRALLRDTKPSMVEVSLSDSDRRVNS